MKDIATLTTRSLRKNQTESEKLFWGMVRNRKLFGRKFLRQHPFKFNYNEKVKFFIADFFCAEKKIIIELDGKIHHTQEEYDELRTFIINGLGIQVIRIKNEELADRNAIIETLRPHLS